MNSHQIIIRPLHTEKGVDDVRVHNTYHFQVAPRATKTQIKHALEELFPSCKVADVRTISVKSKKRRVRYHVTKTSGWKKAIVRLRPGSEINIGY